MEYPEYLLEEIAEVSKLFALAEKKIKQIEHLGQGILFPSVNQLRYVAFHLIRIINKKSDITEDVIKNEIYEAKYHCQRAIYDASEGGIIYYLEEIRIFKKDYKLVIIPDIVDSYLDICKLANEANDFIIERSKQSIGDHSDKEIETTHNDFKSESYNDADNYFQKLGEAYLKLDIARTELNKKINNNRFILITSIITIIIGLLSIIVTIILKC